MANGWGWAIDNLVIQDNAVAAPEPVPAAGFNLAQNVPNPFNPSTTIAFNLPAQSRVKLQIFDVRGRLVHTLVNEVRPTGRNTVVWDGHNSRGAAVASGVYFYQLQAGQQIQKKRMMLIK